MATPLTYVKEDWERFSETATKDDEERSPSEIDRSRIIHSAAFRRLLGKTQVFGIGQDDFFRTRLTHSLEVAQIAKGVALRVGADVETCEAAGLAHDIGHPPYGHRGEEVLKRLMAPYGGFEANAQNFRILAKTEIKFADPAIRGLNLTRAVLDALLKYRTPYPGVNEKFYYVDDPDVLAVTEWAMQGNSEKPLECEVMDWSDDIAYSVHDLEDGIHAGMITAEKALRREAEILNRARKRHPDCTPADFRWSYAWIVRCESQSPGRVRTAERKAVTSELIKYFLQVDVSPRSKETGRQNGRHHSTLVIPPTVYRRCEVLKSMAFELLIDDPRVASLEARAERILTDLFELYRKPEALRIFPEGFRDWFKNAGDDQQRARVTCDFISGMTDEYAEKVYARIFTPGRAALGDY